MSAPPQVTSVGLMAIIPNSKLEEIQRYKDQQAEDAAKKQQNVDTNLAAYISKCWEEAKRVRWSLELRILDSRRQVKGIYRNDILAEIDKFGGSKTFIQHTGNKCSAAQSWIQDIVLPPDEFPASIEPTPIPDLPEDEVKGVVDAVTQYFQAQQQASGVPPDPRDVVDVATKMRQEVLDEIKQDAERKAVGMERKIFDQLAEAGFVDVLQDVIANLIQTPAGILKGPIVRQRSKLSWGTAPVDPANPAAGMKSVPLIERKLGYELASVDPLDFYPSPNMRNVNEGYVIERVRTQRKDLQAMLGVEGYRDDEITKALEEYGTAGLQTLQVPDADRARLENRDNVTIPGSSLGDPLIEGLEFWGSVQGKLLKDWGMEIKEDDLTKEFDICAEKYGSHVVRAVLNPDPLGRKPYYPGSFQEEAGSVWGKGLPEIISDIQDILNGCVRHLQNNLSISSGPQTAIDLSKMSNGFDWKNMHPWKIWPFDSSTGTTPPITFFQPPSNVIELLAVYDKFDQISDDQTVPKYSYGNQQVVGAAATASGLSMLMNAANKRIKKVIATIDRRILRPMLERFYVYNMLYDEDETIKGDVQIVPRGALALVVKEQLQMRRQEFLNTTANPIDMQILGIKGRASLLREVARSLAIPVDKVVPSEDEINREIDQQRAAAAAQAAQASVAQGQPAQPPGPGSQPAGGQTPPPTSPA